MTRTSTKSLLLFTPALLLVATAALATVPRYAVETAGTESTVQDAVTGLEWLQHESRGAANWQAALAHCDGLSYAGKDDWRLPDAMEISTLVDEKKAITGPSINTVYFTDFDDSIGYWTSTTYPTNPTSAYILFFNDQDSTVGRGGLGSRRKDETGLVLCVRTIN